MRWAHERRRYDVELDPVQERVLVDGPGVGSAPAKGFDVCLTGSVDVGIVDRREGDKLDQVDLDPTVTDTVAATGFHLRPTPETERHRDLT